MAASKGNIVLIHGLWMTAKSWEKWGALYTDMGYHVTTPTWSVLEGLNRSDIIKDPSILRGYGAREMLRDFRNFVEKLDSPPIIMGHSFGGLMTQLLLNEGLGTAGVLLHSAQTKGVYRLPPQTIKSTWPALKNPFDVDGIVDFNLKQFHEIFANGISESEAKEIYDSYYIPAPKRTIFQVAFANFTKHAATTVDYSNPLRAPLLFIGGMIDRLVPASVVEENYRRYHTPSKTELKLYPGRSHITAASSGWEEVARYCIQWAEKNKIQTTEQQLAA